jgi:proliferating cell nuclear antigen PCNA
MSSKKNILKFKIEDIKSFKAIIETLVKIVTEITWVIYSPKDDKFKGIEMSVSDPSRSVFIKIQIEDNKLPNFYCRDEKYQLGIDLEQMNQIMKFIENEDKMNMSLNEDDLLNLVIEIDRANIKGKKIKKFPLIEIPYEEKPIKKVDYEKIISTTPNVYKKIFRELADFENVNIKCSNKKIILSYSNHTGLKSEDEYFLDEDGINLDNFSSEKEFVGTFPIKYLVSFVKCAGLCEDINFYFKTEYSLTVKFPILTFGTITIAISPINEECIKNVEYDYSEDEDNIVVIGNNTAKLYYDDS